MRFSLISLVAVVSCLQVSAERLLRRDVEDLLSRQTASSPTCYSTCKVSIDNFLSCTPSTCICTENMAASLQKCLDCVGPSGEGAPDDISFITDSYNTLCEGKNVPKIHSTNSSTSSPGDANTGGSNSGTGGNQSNNASGDSQNAGSAATMVKADIAKVAVVALLSGALGAFVTL
ncbi:hypothetical protein CPC08DRAFT_524973 [Agrocybe pediades]|nr:hypothetical protein CPC08DRAFT_524973 [Agrocybe pediades]